MNHHRVTPQGQAMGKSSARLAERGLQRMEANGLTSLGLPMLRDDMCQSCACKPGTVPNGCLQTQLDLMKSASEGRPFMCHAPKDGKLCAGWARVRAELVANPLPADVVALLDQWDYTPPDEETSNTEDV